MLYAVEKNLESWHSNKQRYFTMPRFLLFISRTWYLPAMEQSCGKLANLDDVVSELVVVASTEHVDLLQMYNPVLAWANQQFDVKFAVSNSIFGAHQNADTHQAVRQFLQGMLI